MIEPIAFGYNSQTAENNYFQVNSQGDSTQAEALKEFTNFVEKLRAVGIEVIVVKDTLEPHTPDSIFPNNWVSFHSDGTAYLYPMFAPNRRDERRMDILEQVRSEGFELSEIVDISSSESQGQFLEGTGSMIFDHDSKIAYGSISLRLDEALFISFCERIGYRAVTFHSYQSSGNERLPIYHTNVMMCVADQFVVICLESIDMELEREKVQETIKASGKEVIEISEEQMHQFAGNMLQVHNKKGEKFLVMSSAAHSALTKAQIAQLESYNTLLYSDLSTIESNGGGSARCMLAEVFLPREL